MQESTPKPLSLKRNILWNTAGSLVYQGCLWLITVLVVILSGYTDSGILAFAMAVGNMFNPIATYSMRTYQVSDVADVYSQRDYIGFRLITLLIGIAFIVPYAIAVTPESSTVIAVMIFLLFKIDEAFVDVLYGIDQKSQRMDYIGVSETIRGILVVVSFSAVLVLGAGLDTAMLAMFVTCFCVTLLFDLPHARRFGSVLPNIEGKRIAALLKTCVVAVIGTLFMSAIVSIARQYYGIVFGVDLLGIYAAIATPAVIVQALARFLYAPALVPLAQKWADSPAGEFKRFFARTVKIMLASVVISVALLTLVGPYLLVLVFGQAVAPYTDIFLYVLISTGLVALLWYFTDTLIICRDFKGLFISTAIAFIACLVTMDPLEHLFGMNGINVVVIVSVAAGFVVAALFLLKDVKAAANRVDDEEEGVGADEMGSAGAELLVSIILPVYNSEDYLQRCLDSVRKQTYAAYEIIAVDDGSTDGSAGLLEANKASFGDKLVIVSQENRGAAAARNRGIALARGECLTFLDNDDFIEPDYLYTFVKAYIPTHADIVCAGYKRPDDTGKIVTEVIPVVSTEWASFAVTAAWAKLYRTAFVQSRHLEFLKTNIGEDMYFTIPAIALAERVISLDYCGYNWYFNSNSVSNTKQKNSVGLQFDYTLDNLLARFKAEGLSVDGIFEYYFIRYIVWFLLFTAKGDTSEASDANVAKYREWLNRNLPAWKMNEYTSVSRPVGERAANRAVVWLFVHHPRAFDCLLSIYR